MYKRLFPNRCLLSFLLAASAQLGVAAAQPNGGDIRQLAEAEKDEAISLFRAFLDLPNDALFPDDILALVDWMETAFEARGFQTQRIATDGSPALFAEMTAPDAEKTALIYLQADGQPVDPAHWSQPDPFDPVLKARRENGEWGVIEWSSLEDRFDPDWRIFARSAADSKGPMTQFLAAVDAMKDAGLAPGYNLKVIIDTEEELGSPNLAKAVAANRDLLSADFLLIFDGPPHASNEPTVVFGARGITTVSLKTYGPKTPQHSGHYGNFVPNPAFHLSRILASMKTPEGKVAVDGFYDGVKLSKDVRAILDAVPDDEEKILAAMGLRTSDEVASSLQAALQYPSLNIRGLHSAWVGEAARTIIPSTALAEIDIRTVKETDPERLVSLVRSHIEDLGYHVVDHAPSDEERAAHDHIVEMTYEVSYGAFRSDYDALAGRVARAGMRRLNGEEPILIRTMGGSIPIAPFVEELDIPAAIVPTVNIDNNQHSPNENLRLGNFVDGIAILISVLTTTPEEAP